MAEFYYSMYIMHTIMFFTYNLRLLSSELYIEKSEEKISVILAGVNKEVLKRSIELSIKICWALGFASIPICSISGNLHVVPLILIQIF